MRSPAHPAALDSDALAAALSRMSADAAVFANQSAANVFSTGKPLSLAPSPAARNALLDTLQAKTRAALRGSAN